MLRQDFDDTRLRIELGLYAGAHSYRKIEQLTGGKLKRTKIGNIINGTRNLSVPDVETIMSVLGTSWVDYTGETKEVWFFESLVYARFTCYNEKGEEEFCRKAQLYDSIEDARKVADKLRTMMLGRFVAEYWPPSVEGDKVPF